MNEENLIGKSKADLLQIVEIAGVMPLSQARKMKKAELVATLLEASQPPASAVGSGKSEEQKPQEGSSGLSQETTSSEAPEKAEPLARERRSRSEQRSSKALQARRSMRSERLAKQTEAQEEALLSQEAATAAATSEEQKAEGLSESSEKPNEGGEEKSAYKQRRRENRREAKSRLTRGDKERHKLPRQRQETTEDGRVEAQEEEAEQIVSGVLEIMPDNYGFLRLDNYLQSSNDIYLPPQYIRRFGLRTGDYVTGPCRQHRENDRFRALHYIKSVNGQSPDKMQHRPHFGRLTPIYPDQRFVLESKRTELSTRIIDLIAPIGKGQRGMIVSPPKAGKTILLQKIANAISENNPEAKLIVLLIDERPEEVTDMQRSIKGEVVFSTFDKTPENHVRITELVLERAERLVELGEDVIILLDSITRLGRAYNLTITPTGRTLSGGLDPGALYGPKRFFGAARNIEGGGSLTILATALIDTGSRMDEVIFEEFKGTGNMEVYLDRKLSEKRIFPAIDITRSGTRREELLLSSQELDAVWSIRKAFGSLDTSAVTETIINLLLKTKSNEQFISSVNVSFNDKSYFEAMRGSSAAPPKENSGAPALVTGGSPWGQHA